MPKLKGVIPHGPALFRVREALAGSLATVCEQALCPNRTDCWARGTLAFQILGNVCTRRCAFCGETTGRPNPANPDEPAQLALAVKRLSLTHVVITSPARDDLPDQGVGQFSNCVRRLRTDAPRVTIETLVPDFQGREDLLNIFFQNPPDVFNHNIETVRRLSPSIRCRADYDRSLFVLSQSSARGVPTKSGLMVGLGETFPEMEEAFNDLVRAGVRSVTVGQYLPPSPTHARVERYYSNEEFDTLRRLAERLFDKIQVGPRVRSSYHAETFSP